VADQEKNNVAVYHNRYRDNITFEHIGDEVIMKGGSWFRYGLSNDYKLVHEYDDEAKSYTELAKKYQSLVFSSDKISMVDPSGGPYISLGNNLKEFWPKGEYQDLIVESIKFVPQSDEDKDDYKSTVIFKIK